MRNAGRTVTMVAMLTLGFTVFLVTLALADASSSDLDSAIRQNSGPPSLVTLDLPRLDSQRPDAVGQAFIPALKSPDPTLAFSVIKPLTGADLRCRGSALRQAPQVYLRMDPPPSADLADATGTRPGDALCVRGTPLPARAVAPQPWPVEYLLKDATLLRRDYAGLLEEAVSTTEAPGPWRVIAWAEVADADLATPLRSACLTATAQARRIDAVDDRVCTPHDATSGRDVRRAGEGVALMYRLLGAAILAIGATGMLIAETIIVRDRRWMFGLAQAYGARAGHVAMLVVLDVALTVVAAAGLTVATICLTRPWLDAVTRPVFDQPLRLLAPGDVWPLVGGGLTVLVLAALWPVVSAVRNDPLDVLEKT